MTYFNDFSASTTKTIFDITFEYLDTSHIHVYGGYNLETEEYETEITTGFTVNGAQLTFDVAPNQALRIIRETPVAAPWAEYYPSVAIRAEDLNDNQSQALYGIEETGGSITEIEGSLDDIINDINDLNELIRNSIDFVDLTDVAALNATALTNPDNLKGYQVLDSTGIDAASPEVLNLPPTAGGAPGQDPINGVYWDSGIITRVQWLKASQKWNFIFYYSGNGDNRYQQQTLAAPITPDPTQYKDGTLWFDSGDGNLYVLYNDGNSRQWVITNPLSAYGQIVTSDDVYWNRNASENMVYPKNSTDSIGNDDEGSNWSINSDGSATFDGTVEVGSGIESTRGDANNPVFIGKYLATGDTVYDRITLTAGGSARSFAGGNL